MIVLWQLSAKKLCATPCFWFFLRVSATSASPREIAVSMPHDSEMPGFRRIPLSGLLQASGAGTSPGSALVVRPLEVKHRYADTTRLCTGRRDVTGSCFTRRRGGSGDAENCSIHQLLKRVDHTFSFLVFLFFVFLFFVFLSLFSAAVYSFFSP